MPLSIALARLSRAIIRKRERKKKGKDEEKETEGRDSRRAHDYRREGRAVALDKFHFTSFLRCAEPRIARLDRSLSLSLSLFLAGHNKLVKIACHRNR